MTAYERLATQIREQILSGELSPGDQLSTEAELSSHYAVSRNTAREALRTLASQGLLTVRRGVSGGTFVTVPTHEQVSGSLETSLAVLASGARLSVSALVEVRELLEVPAAEFAALRRTDSDIAAVRRSLFTPADVDAVTVFNFTRNFHAGVLSAAHNPLLELVAEPVFHVLRKRFLRERAAASMWREVARDHREIYEHLLSQDQAGAREAMRAHLRQLRRLYENIDQEAPPPCPGPRVDGKTSEV